MAEERRGSSSPLSEEAMQSQAFTSQHSAGNPHDSTELQEQLGAGLGTFETSTVVPVP